MMIRLERREGSEGNEPKHFHFQIISKRNGFFCVCLLSSAISRSYWMSLQILTQNNMSLNYTNNVIFLVLNHLGMSARALVISDI